MKWKTHVGQYENRKWKREWKKKSYFIIQINNEEPGILPKSFSILVDSKWALLTSLYFPTFFFLDKKIKKKVNPKFVDDRIMLWNLFVRIFILFYFTKPSFSCKLCIHGCMCTRFKIKKDVAHIQHCQDDGPWAYP